MGKTTEPAALLEPLDSARTSEYSQLAIRLKEELERLNAQADALCGLSIRTASAAGSDVAFPLLERLRQGAVGLVRGLAEHAGWMERELFPVFARYFKKEIEPTLMPSMWVLEKDHELALQYLNQFLEQSGAVLDRWRIEPGQSGAAGAIKPVSDQLTQACYILKGHFGLEEELVFPLANEILTDIDYLFS